MGEIQFAVDPESGPQPISPINLKGRSENSIFNGALQLGSYINLKDGSDVKFFCALELNCSDR